MPSTTSAQGASGVPGADVAINEVIGKVLTAACNHPKYKCCYKDLKKDARSLRYAAARRVFDPLTFKNFYTIIYRMKKRFPDLRPRVVFKQIRKLRASLEDLPLRGVHPVRTWRPRMTSKQNRERSASLNAASPALDPSLRQKSSVTTASPAIGFASTKTKPTRSYPMVAALPVASKEGANPPSTMRNGAALHSQHDYALNDIPEAWVDTLPRDAAPSDPASYALNNLSLLGPDPSCKEPALPITAFQKAIWRARMAAREASAYPSALPLSKALGRALQAGVKGFSARQVRFVFFDQLGFPPMDNWWYRGGWTWARRPADYDSCRTHAAPSFSDSLRRDFSPSRTARTLGRMQHAKAPKMCLLETLQASEAWRLQVPFVCFNKWPFNFDCTVEQFILYAPPSISWDELAASVARTRRHRRDDGSSRPSVFLGERGSGSEQSLPHWHAWVTIGSPAWVHLTKRARICSANSRRKGRRLCQACMRNVDHSDGRRLCSACLAALGSPNPDAGGQTATLQRTSN